MLLNPSYWQLKSVHLGPILCSIMVIYEEGQVFTKLPPVSHMQLNPSLSSCLHEAPIKQGTLTQALGDQLISLWSLAWNNHCRWFKGQVQSAVENM